MATTNVSCEGDRQFAETLGMLAKKRRTTIGRLVRSAIDTAYASDLAIVEKQAALFFADERASEFNSAHESTEAEHA